MIGIGDIKVTKKFSLTPRSTPAIHTCCYNVRAYRVHIPDESCMGIGSGCVLATDLHYPAEMPDTSKALDSYLLNKYKLMS